MIDERKLQESVDRNEIINVISKSILTRDSGRWEELAECYHSRAEFISSWYDGKASDFFKVASEKLEAARREGGEQKHVTANHWIEINDDRAVAECDLILFMRCVINGVDLDFATWSRRLQLMEREDGAWKIRRRWVIYGHDRMDPVDPTVELARYYDPDALSRYDNNIPFHLWRNEQMGSPPAKDICLKGSTEEEAARQEARKWIEGE